MDCYLVTPGCEVLEDEGDFFINFTIKRQDGYFMFSIVVLNFGFILRA